MKDAAWIEHHGTRVVSLAGFAGSLVAMATGEFPIIGAEVGPILSVVIAGFSAALHLANRSLDAFRTKAGLNITPSS